MRKKRLPAAQRFFDHVKECDACEETNPDCVQGIDLARKYVEEAQKVHKREKTT